MLENRLSFLEDEFRKKVSLFLGELLEHRIYVIIIETLRTEDRQRFLLETGKSQTLKSKHLDGKAIDIVPIIEYNYPRVKSVGWDTTHPVWQEIAKIAKSHGLKWGGDWRSFKDYVHFEE